MKTRVSAYIGLGSNLGNREENISAALQLMEQGSIKVSQISSLYKTEPVGYQDQEWFLNGVIRIETTLLPEELLLRLQEIEAKLGKQIRVKWGPRSIDLDILLYGKVCLNLPNLHLPHPLMHERAFVLIPLEQIAPGLRHPILGKTIRVLLSDLKSIAPLPEVIKYRR